MPLISPSKMDIRWLFDEVWPAMKYSATHRDQCISLSSQIRQAFQQYGHNGNELLRALSAISGIGLTIASGLIFSANRDSIVPFDKWTTGYALQLQILQDAFISKQYIKYSRLIVKYIQNTKSLGTILDFVREAGDECQFPFEPQ